VTVDLHTRYERILGDVAAPLAFVDLDAMWVNADDMVRRAGGKPIRVASKSLRCRPVLERILERDGYRGVLAFTLPEALWLHDHGIGDTLVGYPTTDAGALADLARRGDDPTAPVVMVDCLDHLDMIEAARAEVGGGKVRVCLDIDAALPLLGGRLRIGPKRSPVRTVEDAVAMARSIAHRDGIDLVGLMAYEGQVAGVGDHPPGRPLRGLAIRQMQQRSIAELRDRRGRIVSAVRELADLTFVNGGGTGSLEATAADASVTELAAGSGFYAPHLFDHYGHFTLVPAAAFVLPVVRRPGPGVVTALGGGYLASGAADDLRLPEPWLPAGLSYDRDEGAGEVQTPLLGDAADRLRIGDRVYFRHTKAGELCERFDRLHLIAGDQVVDVVPTYRGEGQTFL
jgi:D-serine deaminase-like pyridoxal phosphate-dependent protein